jgi:ElaB/YqjD/DUF883 family membrane-anchored ribosome-binding protein
MDARTNEVKSGRGYSLVEDNPDQIKRDIDRTRAHMDETVTEISQRLSPRNLVKEFTDLFTGREHTRPEDVHSAEVLNGIRENPIPSALIAAGVAYLLFSNRSGGMRSESRSLFSREQVGRGSDRDWLAPGATYEPGEHREGMAHRAGEAIREKGSQAMHTMRDKAGDAMHSLRDRAGDTMHSAGESAGSALRGTGRTVRHWAEEAGSTLGDAARSAGHSVSQAAHSARESLTIDGDRVRQRARHIAGDVRDVVEEYPLVIGAAALAVGLIAGLAAPATRAERRTLGPIRDEFVDDVREGASELRDKIGHTLKEAGRAAGTAISEEASNESESIAENASRAARAAIHSAGDKVREAVKPQDDTNKKPEDRQNKPDQYKPDQNKPNFGNTGSPPIGGPGGGPIGGRPGGDRPKGGGGGSGGGNKGGRP